MFERTLMFYDKKSISKTDCVCVRLCANKFLGLFSLLLILFAFRLLYLQIYTLIIYLYFKITNSQIIFWLTRTESNDDVLIYIYIRLKERGKRMGRLWGENKLSLEINGDLKITDKQS